MGNKGSGIHSIEDLKARCWVDDVTDCWHWRGSKKANGTPSMWLPFIGRSSTMSQALCIFTKGRPLKPGEHFRYTCKTGYCGNPEHSKACDLSTLRLSKKTKRSPVYIAKMMETLRKRSSITDEQVCEIRNSSEAASIVAEKMGISQSYVNKLRCGDRRLPRDAAPGSSVFNWSP